VDSPLVVFRGPTDSGKARVPTLRVKQMDGTMQVAEMNAERAGCCKTPSSSSQAMRETDDEEQDYHPQHSVTC